MSVRIDAHLDRACDAIRAALRSVAQCDGLYLLRGFSRDGMTLHIRLINEIGRRTTVDEHGSRMSVQRRGQLDQR